MSRQTSNLLLIVGMFAAACIWLMALPSNSTETNLAAKPPPFRPKSDLRGSFKRGRSPSNTVASSPSASDSKSKNEKYYDSKYQQWQLSSNKFGMLYKKRYWRDYVQPHMHCAEFGASSGHILKSMPCAKLLGIEINDAARAYATDKLGLNMVQRTDEVQSNSIDFVFSTSTLEHVECPVCELRNLYRITKPGGIISITTPGQAPRSSSWKANDVNFEFQMFGALELGNLLTAAGFKIRDPSKCFSEVTQWPTNFNALYAEVGLERFITLAREYGESHDKLVTTWCVAYKEV